MEERVWSCCLASWFDQEINSTFEGLTKSLMKWVGSDHVWKYGQGEGRQQRMVRHSELAMTRSHSPPGQKRQEGEWDFPNPVEPIRKALPDGSHDQKQEHSCSSAMVWLRQREEWTHNLFPLVSSWCFHGLDLTATGQLHQIFPNPYF